MTGELADYLGLQVQATYDLRIDVRCPTGIRVGREIRCRASNAGRDSLPRLGQSGVERNSDQLEPQRRAGSLQSGSGSPLAWRGRRRLALCGLAFLSPCCGLDGGCDERCRRFPRHKRHLSASTAFTCAFFENFTVRKMTVGPIERFLENSVGHRMRERSTPLQSSE